MSGRNELPTALNARLVRGYLECALWAEMDQSNDQGGEPLDRNYTVDDFAPEALAKAITDCNEFYIKAKPLLERSTERDETWGHDFWLTRNGHGCGFWDGDYDEAIEATNPKSGRLELTKIGDLLTALAKEAGECNVYIGDNEELYFS